MTKTTTLPRQLMRHQPVPIPAAFHNTSSPPLFWGGSYGSLVVKEMNDDLDQPRWHTAWISLCVIVVHHLDFFKRAQKVLELNCAREVWKKEVRRFVSAFLSFSCTAHSLMSVLWLLLSKLTSIGYALYKLIPGIILLWVRPIYIFLGKELNLNFTLKSKGAQNKRELECNRPERRSKPPLAGCSETLRICSPSNSYYNLTFS